jgi:hypothetical protein
MRPASGTGASMQGSESHPASPQLDPKTLVAELAQRLPGRPADGSRPAAGAATAPPKQVVWVDAGLMHSSLHTEARPSSRFGTG